jgi:phosphoglycerate dehydrogenase-like enzyme
LIGPAEFGTLSKFSSRPPFFLNVARGTIIDQEALVDALESGKLAGAAIDVTDPEPLPADSPLWDAPNLVITPHVSSTSSNYFDTALQLFEINLGRSLKGNALINERRLHTI